MTYRIAGLPRSDFSALFAMNDAQLAQSRARRVVADADRGFPCRVSLRDARKGESLILLHHVCHETDGPFRTAFAIYVRETAKEPDPYVDTLPPMLAERDLSLKGFGANGDLLAARLIRGNGGGATDHAIRDLFAGAAIRTIHVHNAAYGCFLCRVQRDGEAQ